jgi:hypothetical protein
MTAVGAPMRKLNVNQANVLNFLGMGWTLYSEHYAPGVVVSYIMPSNAPATVGGSVLVSESDLAVLKKKPKLIAVLRMDCTNHRVFYRLTPAGKRELESRKKEASKA